MALGGEGNMKKAGEMAELIQKSPAVSAAGGGRL